MIQVLCDILTSGGLPGKKSEHQLYLYFAADDLEYQVANKPNPRYNSLTFVRESSTSAELLRQKLFLRPSEYTSFGKPNPFVFQSAGAILRNLQLSRQSNDLSGDKDAIHAFRTLYMIGDNPFVDVKGAQQIASDHHYLEVIVYMIVTTILGRASWFSILTRTGVFNERGNHAEFPADLVSFSIL
ncbi:mitochondrial hydrolase YKR070W-like [Nicotiana tabacum]|uniref:Mitochondrial hydrolase YKR070W-like n=1 Tax=Nicotiana tabacum TaxID=4097 RepID=A0AC58SJ69_TOBAC